MSNIESSLRFNLDEIGKFGIGLWHQQPETPPLDWNAVIPETMLGPFDWTMEAYEVAILCFCSELNVPAYLAQRDNPVPLVPPVAAVWASFSLLQGYFVLGAIVDVSHEVCWHEPMRAGDPVQLAGKITEKYEKRGRHYLVWDTHCTRPNGTAIFDVRHTIIDLSVMEVV
ncbi:MAG: hypothetical protein EPO47_11015 [Rugosibacter sp.]|nr:MAG: hypothetical protein EPO60_11440 [Rugosibacter sp.]TBR07470.1 MAG: hypothetical protein EPO47_11015 [Rugosibacter sp.]